MIALQACACPRCKRASRPLAFIADIRRITENTMSLLAARKAERDAILADLLNALEVLRRQRGVAIAIEAGAEHLAELDAEEAAYFARARALGAAWA
ncbi:hypothetical protein [Bradyrhizobium sp. BTAi1]|jgi:hypothetical protein|uniref:hypothetical protein n=1 Tax=Bradyrhizobium sp. (strain BTAi1 / ATCC BAA-1182) TaxID=288000 RepID=UPI0001519AEB|nr:hypothetical protein [Bradyrhizobium sp. BTAi1]ABQ38527.1 hypothetical protein BBta_6624 [Bradyrhizobium sp. BTAi1]